MKERRLAWWALAVAVGAGFHAVEHVVQALQKYALGSPHAHGLMGAHFDNDPAHFLYNWAFFFALVPVLAAGPGLRPGPTWTLFVAGFAIQSYHVVEHTVKGAQWASGVDPSPGILGHWFPLVPLHLAINTVVYLFVAPRLLAWARRARVPAADAMPEPDAQRAS